MCQCAWENTKFFAISCLFRHFCRNIRHLLSFYAFFSQFPIFFAGISVFFCHLPPLFGKKCLANKKCLTSQDPPFSSALDVSLVLCRHYSICRFPYQFLFAQFLFVCFENGEYSKLGKKILISCQNCPICRNSKITCFDLLIISLSMSISFTSAAISQNFFLDALRVTPGGVGLLTGSWTSSPVELSPQCRCLLGWPIASARSSGTDDYLTVCSTVLRGSSGTCQLLLRCVSVITNRESCRFVYDDSRQLEWGGPPLSGIS